MVNKGYNSEELGLTENQSNDAWKYISEMQADVAEKTTGEQLRNLFKDKELTLGQKIYIAYIFGKTEERYCEINKIERDAC